MSDDLLKAALDLLTLGPDKMEDAKQAAFDYYEGVAAGCELERQRAK